MADVIPPRIIKIQYRSGVNGKVAVAFAKVPYGGIFDLNEKMSRLFSRRQVRWFRISEATNDEIIEHRSTLVRWPEALDATVARTKINVLA